MSKKPEQFDDGWSVGDGYSRISTRKHRDETYEEGEVATPHGFVVVYSQGSDLYQETTRLDFICKGRCYCRTIRKRFTKRGLITKAKQFAKEIAG